MIGRRALLAAGGALALGAGGWRLTTGSMAGYDRWAAELRAWPAAPEIAALVRLATLAPNSHNSQPWRFRIGPDRIDIGPDLARRVPVVDPDDHHLHVSLGAAVETLAIAGAALGRPGEVVLGPDGPGFVHSAGSPRPGPLAEAIPRRQSTRAEYDGRPLDVETLGALAAAAGMPGVRLILLTEPAVLGQVRDLVVTANGAQMGDPAFMSELRDWIRFNPRAAIETGDGLFSGASGNPSLPTALGRAVFPWVITAAGENERYARQLASSAGCAVFFAERANPEGWVQVGRACQRFALAATARDVRLAFVNQPVEVAAFRTALAALAGEPDRRPDLLLRFGRGAPLPFSPRRPVAAVVA